MQFPTLFIIAALATGAFADLHIKAVCVDYSGDAAIYNEAATRAACEAYKNRNTGDSQWDQCPDCTYVDSEPPHCESAGWHMGGDEINEYCQAAGAAQSLAN